MRLVLRDGKDPRHLAWGRPDSPVRELCAACHGKLPEVPVMFWAPDGACVQFCDKCFEDWFTVAP